MDQLTLFPLVAVETEGYAHPEPRSDDADDNTATDDDMRTEAA